MLCDATADVLRTGFHVQVSRVRRNRPVRVCCTAFAPQRVRSKVESLRTLHQYTNVIGIARRAGHACSSSSTSGTTTFVESLRTVRGARATASVCVRLRCVCNSACDGRVAAPVYMPMQWNTRRNHRSVSASGCTMRCDGRSSSSRAAGSIERLLRAVDPNRSLASSDVAKLGVSQAALHRPCAPNSECCRTNRGPVQPRPNRASKHNGSSVASWWAARESCATALRHVRFGTARPTTV
jgi:hypothetical protein